MTHPGNADPGAAAGAAATASNQASPTTTRLLYGGYLVLALAAAVLSWRQAPSALAGVAAMLVILTVVTSLLTVALSRANVVAAQVLLWAILATILVAMAGVVSVLLFGWPEQGRISLSRLVGTPSIVMATGQAAPLVLPAEGGTPPSSYSEAPNVDGDAYDRLAILSRRRPVTISGGTVRVSQPSTYFGVLRIENGTLVVAGSAATIEVGRLEVEGTGLLRGDPPGAPPNGPGLPGPSIKLVVHETVRGTLSVDLTGGRGGPGVAGAPGAGGANGAPGQNSSQSLVGCNHGGGQGGAGDPGGRGQDGSPGGPGGAGGSMVLYAPDRDAAERAIHFVSEGGPGGTGGQGGPGGAGGSGGPGGRGGGYCGGGQNGPDGAVGPGGNAGRQGSPGAAGSLSVVELRPGATP